MAVAICIDPDRIGGADDAGGEGLGAGLIGPWDFPKRRGDTRAGGDGDEMNIVRWPRQIQGDAGFDAGTEVSGVLSLPRHELAVSGKVERVGTDGALLKLDLLIEEYKTALSAYMTELQMLDFVV